MIDLRVSIEIYEPKDSAEAMGLETRASQGKAYRLRFDRAYFHRRAENYDSWRLVTARTCGRLVGICGGALKPAIFDGRDTLALYLFDIRVAPEVRRQGVARQLTEHLIGWARDKAEIGYAYAVGDNEAVARFAQRSIGAAAAPACSYLVFPTSGASEPRKSVASVDPQMVHSSFVAREGPFGLYSNPAAAFADRSLIGSWLYQRGNSVAGCSAWSNAEILSEVVERLPVPLAALGAALRMWPLKHLRTPHIPQVGERLRSWYVFDFHASDDDAALALMNEVAAKARAHGIDYCYIIHRAGAPWIRALQRQFARPFAPIIPYSIMGRMISGEAVCIDAPYVDIRDV